MGHSYLPDHPLLIPRLGSLIPLKFGPSNSGKLSTSQEYHFSPEDGGNIFLRNIGINLCITTRKTNIDIFGAVRTVVVVDRYDLLGQI
jgi:hypothetical protein